MLLRTGPCTIWNLSELIAFFQTVQLSAGFSASSTKMSFIVITMIIAALISLAIFGISIYVLVCLDELKTDMMNPMDTSRQLNKIVPIEYVLQLLTSLIVLVNGAMWMSLWTVPLTAYNAKKYYGAMFSVFDPTLILQRSVIRSTTYEYYMKCGHSVISFIGFFFYSMYCALV